MTEQWLPVKGYKGLYEVSNLGRVKSLARFNNLFNPRKNKYYTRKKRNEIILKNVKKTIGYEQVSLAKNSVQKLFLVHRLVVQAFIPNPENKPQVNHKDGNGFNNSLENLEWCTASENGLHSYRVLKNKAWNKGKFGKLSPKHTSVIQKSLSGEIIKIWDCGMDAVRSGFESSGICRCCKKQNKTHNGFIWEYV